MSIIHVDWVATRAADRYQSRALELRAAANQCFHDGFSHQGYEWAGLAMIAERAATAERTNPPDHCEPCHVCGGKTRCDIGYHRTL